MRGAGRAGLQTHSLLSRKALCFIRALLFVHAVGVLARAPCLLDALHPPVVRPRRQKPRRGLEHAGASMEDAGASLPLNVP